MTYEQTSHLDLMRRFHFECISIDIISSEEYEETFKILLYVYTCCVFNIFTCFILRKFWIVKMLMNYIYLHFAWFEWWSCVARFAQARNNWNFLNFCEKLRIWFKDCLLVQQKGSIKWAPLFLIYLKKGSKGTEGKVPKFVAKCVIFHFTQNQL